MKRSTLNEIQGVLVTVGHTDLAKELVVGGNDQAWLEKKVKHPKTGNLVKVKSLPPELQKKYRPKKKVKKEKSKALHPKEVGNAIKNITSIISKTTPNIKFKIEPRGYPEDWDMKGSHVGYEGKAKLSKNVNVVFDLTGGSGKIKEFRLGLETDRYNSWITVKKPFDRTKVNESLHKLTKKIKEANEKRKYDKPIYDKLPNF